MKGGNPQLLDVDRYLFIEGYMKAVMDTCLNVWLYKPVKIPVGYLSEKLLYVFML